MLEATGNAAAEAPKRKDNEERINSVEEIGNVPEQPLDGLVAEGDNACDSSSKSDRSEPQRSSENCVADCPRRSAVNGEDQHDEEHVGQLEQVPEGPQQPLEKALVIKRLEPARRDECQRTEDAEQQCREKDGVETSPGAPGKKEFGKFTAGGIASADHDGLDP